MLLSILILRCQLIDKDARIRVIMINSYFMPERLNWTSLRLGVGFGNLTLYSDNIGSAPRKRP